MALGRPGPGRLADPFFVWGDQSGGCFGTGSVGDDVHSPVVGRALPHRVGGGSLSPRSAPLPSFDSKTPFHFGPGVPPGPGRGRVKPSNGELVFHGPLHRPELHPPLDGTRRIRHHAHFLDVSLWSRRTISTRLPHQGGRSQLINFLTMPGTQEDRPRVDSVRVFSWDQYVVWPRQALS